MGPDIRERLEQLGPRAIRDAMPEQHREFLRSQPWAIAEDVIEEIQAMQLGKVQSKALSASMRRGHKHASELRVSP